MNPLTRMAVGLVRSYQIVLSPMIHFLAGPGAGCRFTPTCSDYAIEALRVHGFWKGTRMAIWRVMRCNPFCKCGYDPVKKTEDS